MLFNEKAAQNLARIVAATNASIVLTTTHRVSYSIDEWKAILKTRGILSSSISKINDLQKLPYPYSKAAEIKAWVEQRLDAGAYVIIDDDLSINSLPASIKAHCVLTSPMIGLDDERADLALKILYQ